MHLAIAIYNFVALSPNHVSSAGWLSITRGPTLIRSRSIISAPNTVSVEAKVVVESVVCSASTSPYAQIIILMGAFANLVTIEHELINLGEKRVATMPHQIGTPTSFRENLFVI